MPSWPDQLARYRAFPEEAFKHLVDEYCALALNHRSGLFGPGKSLRDRLRADGACEVHALADAAMDMCEWAVYRVRRCYSARAQAWRAVEIIHRADRAEAERFVGDLSDSLQIAVRIDGEHTRLWLTVETEDYPRLEEFFVAAPNTINPKKRSGFKIRWGGHADERLLALEHAALSYADSGWRCTPSRSRACCRAATTSCPPVTWWRSSTPRARPMCCPRTHAWSCASITTTPPGCPGSPSCCATSTATRTDSG